MKNTDILIIGGSAGGLAAAISARRNYPAKEITLVRQERHVLIPCGIPYIFGTLESIEKDLIADTILQKEKVKLIIDTATRLDRERKVIETAGGREIRYQKLILATGSSPIVPPIEGVNLENVFVVKKDIAYLKNVLMVLDKVEEIVVIGGGFIGVEFADELRKRDERVTIVEMLPHLLQLAYDEEFCVKAEEKLVGGGVKILTNSTVQKITGEKVVERVELKRGGKLRAGAVVLGIGVKPNTGLAEGAGLKIGKTKAIQVDEYQRTSDKDIFAIGDCAEKVSFFTGRPSALRLASIATREARIAGANLFEVEERNEGTIGTFSTIVGDLALGVAGLTEKSAVEAGIKVIRGEATTACKHPGSMPGSKEIHAKLLFTEDGQIVGGHIYGDLAVGEVSNIVAALIQKRARVEDVIKLQIGTHPALTPSPISYPIVNAAEVARSHLKRQ